MIRVVSHGSFDVAPEVREGWDRLADLDPAAAPFRRHAWISMLWSAYEREAEPYLLAVFQDDTLMGVAPWVRAIRHFGRQRISVLSDMAEGAPRSSPWLCDPARSATVGRALLEHLRDHPADWDLFLLPDIAEDRLAGIEPVLNDLRVSRHIETADRRCVLFPGGTQWAQYLLGLRPEVVAALKRQDRILGDLEVTQVTGDDLTSELVSGLLVLPRSRAPRTGSEPLRVRPDLERFLGSGLRKHIVCSTVSLGEEIIAFTFWGAVSGGLAELFTGVNPGYRSLELGDYVRRKTLEHGLDSHLHSVFVAPDRSEFGAELGGSSCHDRTLIVYRSPWLGYRHRAGRGLRRWAIRIVQWSRQLLQSWPGRVRADLNDLHDRDPKRSRPRILVRYGRLLVRRVAAYIFFQMRFYRMQGTVREMTFPVLPPPRIKDLEVRELSIRDIPLFHPWLHRMKPEDLIGRFGKGDRCWAAITGGGVVGYLWSTDRDHYERNSGTHLQVLPGETYLYDGGVVEAYRNKGMINYVFDSLVRDPVWEPNHAFFAWVEISNHVPQKILARFNFKAQYILRRRRCFGIGWTVIESAPENVPLRTRGSRGPAKHR